LAYKANSVFVHASNKSRKIKVSKKWVLTMVAAEEVTLQAHEKCIKSHAPIAGRKQKFLSNQLKEGLCTVEIATRSISQKETDTEESILCF